MGSPFLIRVLALSTLALVAHGKDLEQLLASEFPPRTNLMVFSRKQTLEPVNPIRDWQQRRADILKAMQQVMGPLPGKAKRCPLDPRIEGVVSSCGFDSFVDYMNGDLTGWTSQRYMHRQAAYKGRVYELPVDFYEMIGALASRAVFANAPLKDGNSKWDSVDRVVDAARSVFALYGAAANLVVRHPDSTHDFPDLVRQEAYQFLDRKLIDTPPNQKWVSPQG
jgi:hypothetical protein